MRQLGKPWLDEYLAYICPASESPHQFHWWAACTAIASVLKRKVYINRGSYQLFPNMFTILVGRAGIGKGAAMGPITSIMEEAGAANILSDRLTMEYILEKLSKGFPTTSVGPSGISLGLDSSATIVSPELSILLTASLSTLPILADLWDSRDRDFSYGTRHKGEYKIKSPCVSLLGGSTPAWLISSVPANAVGGGFTRRVNFVYGKAKSKRLPWPVMNHTNVKVKLIEDLRAIAQLHGEFKFTAGARSAFEKIYDDAEPKEFDDEATGSYKTSLASHSLKTAMCVSASRGDDMTITEQDLATASIQVGEVAEAMPLVFRAMGESTLAEASDRILRFIEDRGYASFQEIIRVNWRHVSLEDAQRIIAAFVHGGILVERQRGNQTMYEVNPNSQGGKKP